MEMFFTEEFMNQTYLPAQQLKFPFQGEEPKGPKAGLLAGSLSAQRVKKGVSTH